MKGIRVSPLAFGAAVGSVLSCAIAAGIMGRSWDSFFITLATGAFVIFIGAMLVAGGVRATIACVILVGFVLALAERLYLVNGDSYPPMLARDLGTADMKTLEMLRAKECRGEVIEVYEKTNYTWVIRCGFSWVGGHTYISNADPYRTFRQERAQ